MIVLVAAALAVLAGCSSAGDYADEADYGGDPAFDGGEAYEDSMAAQDEGAPAADRTVTTQRAVIVTGEMFMTVEDPIQAAAEASSIVTAAGGRIDARSERAPEGAFGGSAVLTLRVPAARLDSVVDSLRALGEVDEYATNSYDVTNEVTDLESRISTLRESTARIEGLIADADDISDVIELENELARRQGELEGLEARQRGLDDQVSMSTLTLSLTTEPVVIIQEEEPDTFWDGLVTGWEALVAFVSGLLVVLGVLLPWLAVLGLILFVVLWLARRGRARRAKRRAAAPAPGVPAPAPAQAAPQQASGQQPAPQPTED